MKRTIAIHQNSPEPYRAALIEAFKWVAEEGGTLILATKRTLEDLKRFWKDASRKGKVDVAEITAKSKGKTVGIEIAHGQQFYSFCGPRTATFNCSDTDMKRIEAFFESNWYDNDVVELRAFTMAIDTHKKWTEKYQPEMVDSSLSPSK